MLMFTRSSGVVLHLSSLPGPYGIGSMGREARQFVDFLRDAGGRYWQLLPLGPVQGIPSPYMSPSSRAGNPLFIDLEDLAERGLLTGEELVTARYENPDRVDYDWVRETREPLLRLAFQRAGEELLAEMAEFSRLHADWLPDYALFMAAREHFGVPLQEWPDKALVRRTPAALKKYRELLAEGIRYHIFLQYIFFEQWHALKAYANGQGVSIIGDLPIYVAADSVDVWTDPKLFRVDAARRPRFVAGVDADLFSDEGQLWGNPLYNWPGHAKENYRWWCDRVRRSMDFYDIIRIDHFRGFDSYWEIPADSDTALNGKWKRGPGMKLIRALEQQVPEAVLIAEDVGDLNDTARKFITEAGVPGMRILVDAFGDPSAPSDFLPHRCPEGSIMYISTHDTPTFVQWLETLATDQQRAYAVDYLRLRQDEGYGWGAIAGGWASPCVLAMATLQDILGLGADARMNCPGTVGPHNWSWRVRAEALNPEVSGRLRHLNQLYGRLS